MGMSNLWQVETAAMLSQVGFVILPEGTLQKLYRGEELEGEEKQVFDMHPVITSDLLGNIPRLDEIAKIITYQEKHFDGTGNPKDAVKGEDIPPGARILKVVLDFDMLNAAGMSDKDAIAQMENREGLYDPAVLRALKMAQGVERKYEIMSVGIHSLETGMILAQDVMSDEGRLLISRGQEVSRPLIQRLRNFAEFAKVKEPIRVIARMKG